jgi:uncharacterized protein
MEKIIDIAFPDLEDKNVRIKLNDTLSPRTFKVVLDNLPVEVSINKCGEDFYMDRTTVTVGQEYNVKIEVIELDIGCWP